MLNEWSIPFVGREEELASISEHLQAWGTRRMIFIAGTGGIGKTRLLNEIALRFSNLPDFQLKIPEIIDFDDDRYQFPGNVGFTMARQLDVEVFEPYFEASRELHIAEERYGDTGIPTVTRKALAVNRIFIENFNAVTAKSRVLLRFDTTDAVFSDDTLSFKYLFDLASQLKNVITLIAGRNAEELYNELGMSLGSDASLITLQPFALADSRTYLQHKQKSLKVTLDTEWVEKLFVLAGGRPILIDMAIEWAQNHRSLEGSESLSLSDLQTLEQQAQSRSENAEIRLADLRRNFATEVVMPTAHLRTHLDRLKLVLAKVYPLDIEGIMQMLDISQHKAEQLLSKANRSVAIKRLPDERIKLHDAVQELINLYVWPQLDSKGEWEQSDSRNAIKYLTNKSEKLFKEMRSLRDNEYKLIGTASPSELMKAYGDRRDKEFEFWALRVERLRRQLQDDISQGLTMFWKDYDLALAESSSFNYRGSLLSTIEPYGDLESPRTDFEGKFLSKSERLRLQEEIALEARYSGMYDRAAFIYEKLLTKIPSDNERYLSVLKGQVNLWVRAGKLQDAMRANERALNLSQNLGLFDWELDFKITTGWVHRLMGKLDMAQRYYNDALRMAMAKDNDMRIALLYNSLAYVHALQHQDRAVSEIERAIVMWQKLVREREGTRFYLGQAYNIAGEICLELEQPEEALVYFELSWNIFNLEEAQNLSQGRQSLEWKSKSRSGRGFAYWQLAQHALSKGDKSAASSHLEAARVDLEWANKHAAPFDAPVILNRLGEVYFLKKNYPETERVWLQSINEARQIGDAFSELHSLSDLARVAFYHSIDEFSTWRDFEVYYKQYIRRRSPVFAILRGLLDTYLGHLALKAGQFDDAKRLYESGLIILAQKGTYGNFNLAGQLEFMETEVLPKTPNEIVRKLGGDLQEIWMKRTQDITALAYFRAWARQAD